MIFLVLFAFDSSFLILDFDVFFEYQLFLLVLWYLICLVSLWFQSRLEEVYTVIILFLCGLVHMLYHWMFLYICFFWLFLVILKCILEVLLNFIRYLIVFYFLPLGFQFLLVLWRTFSSFKKCSYYCQYILYDRTKFRKSS